MLPTFVLAHLLAPTVARIHKLPQADDWLTTTERRWNPLPQEAPYLVYAQTVLKDRWGLVDTLEGIKSESTGEEEEEFGGGPPKGVVITDLNDYEVAYTRHQPLIQFTEDSNTLMASWGYLFWGDRLKQYSWMKVSRLLSRLWIAAPETPSAFDPKTSTFQAATDPADQAMSAFWAVLFKEKLDSVTIPEPQLEGDAHAAQEKRERAERLADHESFQRAVKLATVKTDCPARALLQARLLVSSICPDEAKRELTTALAAYTWPDSKKVKQSELPILVWALAEASKSDPKLKSKLESATSYLASKQFLTDDPLYPSEPVFGSIELDGVAVPNNLPYAAIALCEAGDVLKSQETMQRGVAAMRAAFGLFRMFPNLPRTPLQPPTTVIFAFPEFGAKGYDLFTPWKDFESCEGKIVAAAGYLTDRFGSLYEVAPDKWVGIDFVRAEGDNAYNLAHNMPVPFTIDVPYKTAKTYDNKTVDFPTLLRRPTIVDAMLDESGPKPAIDVTTGYSVTSQDIVGAKTPLSLTVTSGNQKPVTLEPGDQGFRAVVDPSFFDSPLTAILRHGNIESTHRFDLFITPPLGVQDVAPRGWKRYGMLNRALPPAKTDPWLSTRFLKPGKADPTLIGNIDSPAFPPLGRIITFEVRGSDDCRFQMVNADTGDTITDFIADSMEPTKIQWDTNFFPARSIKLRLLDTSAKGFVEVSNVTISPIKP